MENIRTTLRKKIGIHNDDFKYFGGSFIHYADFCAYQHNKINDLSDEEAYRLLQYIETIEVFKIRHIDFYEPTEQYPIHGVYFHENGALITYSRP